MALITPRLEMTSALSMWLTALISDSPVEVHTRYFDPYRTSKLPILLYIQCMKSLSGHYPGCLQDLHHIETSVEEIGSRSSYLYFHRELRTSVNPASRTCNSFEKFDVPRNSIVPVSWYHTIHQLSDHSCSRTLASDLPLPCNERGIITLSA